MAYPYDLTFFAGQAGLTLTASVVDKASVPLGAQPAYNIRSLGDGWYLYTTDAMPDGTRGSVKILNGGTVVSAGPVNPRENENADVKTSSVSISPLAAGDTPVNHDTGGVDNLAYKTGAGVGISGAIVRAYLKTDYDAGVFAQRDQAVTNDLGRWAAPMFLNSGNTYVFIYQSTGLFGPDKKEQAI
jgi:hypothetical protein